MLPFSPGPLKQSCFLFVCLFPLKHNKNECFVLSCSPLAGVDQPAWLPYSKAGAWASLPGAPAARRRVPAAEVTSSTCLCNQALATAGAWG